MCSVLFCAISRGSCELERFRFKFNGKFSSVFEGIRRKLSHHISVANLLGIMSKVLEMIMEV